VRTLGYGPLVTRHGVECGFAFGFRTVFDYGLVIRVSQGFESRNFVFLSPDEFSELNTFLES
jgi:hypothetical protein